MIYFDMDGVLCDFDGTYTTIAGIKWDHATAKTKEQKREKWARLDPYPRFFAELPWMPGAKDMLLRIRDKIGADHIGILSAAAKHLPDCPAQKLEWIERETPWIEPQNRLIVLRKRDKTLHACGKDVHITETCTAPEVISRSVCRKTGLHPSHPKYYTVIPIPPSITRLLYERATKQRIASFLI